MSAATGKTEAGAIRGFAVKEWHKSALLLAAIVLLPFVIFPAEALGRRVFYLHDVQYYFYPYHKLTADYLRQGILPLWNPYAFSGIPLLGDGQTAIFYPPNWFFFFLPATLALNYAILSQFSIAGAGMLLFARNLQLSRGAAVAGALAYMFNGFITTRVVHLSIMSGAALVPIVFWSVDRLRVQPTPRRFAAAALCVAFQSMAGHPQTPIYTALAVGLYLVTREITDLGPQIRRLARLVALLGGVYAAGYSLAAIQLLPWIDFARLSPRAAAASFELVALQSLRWSDWLLLIMPYIFGGARRSILSPDTPFLPAAIYVWERSAYVGILPLGLAAVALPIWAWRRGAAAEQRFDARLALCAVLVLGLLIAGTGDTFISRTVYATPVVGKLRAYSRAIVLVAFAASALAAVGLQQLLDATANGRLAPRLRTRVWLIAAALVGLFGFVVLLLPWLLAPAGEEVHRQTLYRNLSLTRAATFVPVIFMLASAGLLLWWSRRGVGRTPWPAIILIATDMLLYATAFNPTTGAAAFEGTPDSVAFLQRDRSLYRTATFLNGDDLAPQLAQAQLAQSWGMVFGIPSLNGFNSLQPRRYTDVLFGRDVEDVSYGFLGDNALLQPDSDVLSMLGAKYVLIQPGMSLIQPDLKLSPGPHLQQIYQDHTVTIYRNTRVYPRAYFVSNLRLALNAGAALDTLQGRRFNPLAGDDFDPRTEAIVEADLDPALVARLSRTDSTARATVEHPTPNRITVRTQSRADRFLVLGEMYMPGWYATIDGQPATIYRANYLFRGLIVPAGEHRIELVYRPLSAVFGAALTGVTGLALISAAGWRRGSRRVNRGIIAVRGTLEGRLEQTAR